MPLFASILLVMPFILVFEVPRILLSTILQHHNIIASIQSTCVEKPEGIDYYDWIEYKLHIYDCVLFILVKYIQAYLRRESKGTLAIHYVFLNPPLAMCNFPLSISNYRVFELQCRLLYYSGLKI